MDCGHPRGDHPRKIGNTPIRACPGPRITEVSRRTYELFQIAYSKTPGFSGWQYNRHLSFGEMLELPNRLVQGLQTCADELPAIQAEMRPSK